LALFNMKKATVSMALRPPPPPWEVLQQVSDLVGGRGVKDELDKSMRSLAQSALSRLDMVSREEFDAQTALLQRTYGRVTALETALEELTRELDALIRQS
jgi:ubiquinone biosynthesis accessory factor UbiK